MVEPVATPCGVRDTDFSHFFLLFAPSFHSSALRKMPLFQQLGIDFRRSWRQLAIVHVLYGAIASILLAPAVSVLLRVFMWTSGKTILSDLDILFFLLSPMGIAAAVFVGAVTLTIVALEMAVLMVIGFAGTHGRSLGYLPALVFCFKHAAGIVRVAAEVIGRSLLAAAPFLAGGGAVYLLLLGGNDINFYLSTRPPVFWVAGSLIGILLALMTLVLLRLMSGWVLAVPLMLFEQAAARDAVALSKSTTLGRRWPIVKSLAIWLVAATVFGSLVTGSVGLLGRLLVPPFSTSLGPLVFVLGAVLLLAGVANFAATFVNTSFLALLIVRLFREVGRGEDFKASGIEAGAMLERVGRWQLKGRVVVWGALAAGVAALIAGTLVVRGVRLEDRTQITAHRGASAAAPENTMAAVTRAIEDGAHWVEIDVQETADGEVVVFHDSDFKKVAGMDLKIWDATMPQLQEIDIGSFFDASFANERVPTLAQVLEACHGKIGVNIELKYYGHDQKLEERVVEIVEQTDMAAQVVLMSLAYDGVQKIRALRPDWKIGLLTTVSLGDVTRQDLDFLAVNARAASATFIEAAHRNQKQVLVWTVNDAVTMSQMMSRGVDGIITDEPALGISVLRQRATLTPGERLLLELADLFGIEAKYGTQ